MPNYGFPSLTPAYGLGSYGRTGAALTISSPRSKIGSQGRIYAYYRTRGQGRAYEQYLINALGLKYLPKVNPWTYI
jgi:hypothetical protein